MILSSFSSDELSEALAHRGTQWQFILKCAPWFGGFWERLIGLTKSSLRKTLGRTHTTVESLQTIVVEVEALLNNHPSLTHLQTLATQNRLHRPTCFMVQIITLTRGEDDEVKDPDLGDVSVKRRARVHAIIIKYSIVNGEMNI